MPPPPLKRAGPPSPTKAPPTPRPSTAGAPAPPAPRPKPAPPRGTSQVPIHLLALVEKGVVTAKCGESGRSRRPVWNDATEWDGLAWTVWASVVTCAGCLATDMQPGCPVEAQHLKAEKEAS